MHYIATFHTHLGAMTFKNRLQAMGDTEAVMMPVPRALSSSCGTCVRFSPAFDQAAMYDEDLERVVREENGVYTTLYENDD